MYNYTTTTYTPATDLFDDIDSMFNSFINAGFTSFGSSNFPPTNQEYNPDTKEVRITVALAGVTQDNISLGYNGDLLTLIVEDANQHKDDGFLDVVGRHQLKLVESLKKTWKVDPSYFDYGSTQVSFENGLLSITIKPREEITRKTQLFGNLDISKKIAITTGTPDATTGDSSIAEKAE